MSTYRLIDRGRLLGVVDPVEPIELHDDDDVAREAAAVAGRLATAGVGRAAATFGGDRRRRGGCHRAVAGGGRRQPAARAGVAALAPPAGRRPARPARRCLQSSLGRYAAGSRATPDPAAGRLHVVAMVCADFAGAYNDYGMRRWFVRPRPSLEGGSIVELLGTGWDPTARRPPRSASWRRPCCRSAPPDRTHPDADLLAQHAAGLRLPVGARQRAPGSAGTPRAPVRRSTWPTRPPALGPNCCATRRSSIQPTSPVWRRPVGARIQDDIVDGAVPITGDDAVVRGGPDTYPACQALAAAARASGASAVVGAFSGAGRRRGGRLAGGSWAGARFPADAQVLVLYGARPDLVGQRAVAAGHPPADLVADVRPLYG